MLTFDSYQDFAKTTARKIVSDNECLLITAIALAGESGELCNKIKKIVYHGHQIDISDIIEELGDILWYIANFCNYYNISLDNIAAKNIEKLKARYPAGFSNEASIKREK
ncbi:MAG: nucleoside triphosphate pyrophosphohydrolase family protein [Fervidobacterium sp.]|uniref:nucleoside triphosphate pyrophosphohydrolase family protein n=1 Tax=Fervidobacterium sp. TaxID=1871331 RepID=UPI0025C49884|nr:nucleoside triphosphate pyrophosphohydrolase family protein [Fervidobacterium sp.]NPU90220.1 nucleoside triphosphate pyrophosphohydrolase family protein [Fervidobacterium sp.]